MSKSQSPKVSRDCPSSRRIGGVRSTTSEVCGQGGGESGLLILKWTHGTRSGTLGTEHSEGKQRIKAPKSPRRSRSLIEEEVEGPLIWSWSERDKVSKGIRAIDLERTSGRRSVTLGKFTPETCVCGDVRTPKD